MERVSWLRLAVATAIVAMASGASAAAPTGTSSATGSLALGGTFPPSTEVEVSIAGPGGASIVQRSRVRPDNSIGYELYDAGKFYGGSAAASKAGASAVNADKATGWTSPSGTRLVDSVGDWTTFIKDAAARNVIALPNNGFGTYRLPGVETQPRTSFALLNGQFVDANRYWHDVASPFSLFCRSDEGPPKTLATGDRFAFEVADATALLRLRNVVDRYHSFDLPGKGYAVSAYAGKDPNATWASLQGLARDKQIFNLERDPCYRFLPEGRKTVDACTPGERMFPDKAFRIDGRYRGRLSDLYSGAPVDNGFVVHNPAVPTPFFDPGDRPGDDRPPTLRRTSADGSYEGTVNGLNGAMEMTVAAGCDEHTTTALAVSGIDALASNGTRIATQVRTTPQTVARPPAETPPTMASTPPEKPADGQRVCGPDVTDYVVAVMQLMIDRWDTWGAAEREQRCDDLYALSGFKFNYAWDLLNFHPSERGETDDPSKPGYVPHIFFQSAAPGYCAVPRWPCGSTVQFFGRCIDAQEVNYVQWGLMNQLCDTQIWGIGAHWTRSLFNGPLYARQDTMSLLGDYFGSYRSNTLERRKRVMKRLLDDKISNDRASWDESEAFRTCALECEKYKPDVDLTLRAKFWGFTFGTGFTYGIPISLQGSDLLKTYGLDAPR